MRRVGALWWHAAEPLEGAGVQIWRTVFMGLDTSWPACLCYGNPEIADHTIRRTLESTSK